MDDFRMKRLMAVTAAALAVGVGMAGSAVVATPGTARASTPMSWNLIFQSRTAGYFASMAAISKTNVWAVGDLTRGNVFKPLIRHFNGRTWTAVTIPGASMTSDTVQATSASDVWVFGFIGHLNYEVGSAAYRWDGAHWHRVPMPAYMDLQGTVVLGPSNVWAFGGSTALSGDVFHWDGSEWKAYNLGFHAQSMSASSADNIWLAGTIRSGKTKKAVAYRWDGRRWLSVSMPHPVADYGVAVTALSPSNVWIGWNTVTTVYATRWDGHHWHQLTAPGSVEANSSNIIPDGRGGYWWGPFADWTGHAWISAAGMSPLNAGGGFGPIVRIPRTLSFLMAAGVVNAGSLTQNPTLYRLDLNSR
jgi:hypothetical protein